MLPGSFIPIVEESDVILRVGEWVLRQACRENSAWNKKHKSSIPVAVNLAPQQLVSRSLLDVVKQALKESELPADLLEVELTERALIRDPHEAAQLLKGLSDLGVLVSVDDFGTGYSSLTYLKRFPIDKLKIDRSFIDGLPHDPEDVAIVRAIINLGESLGLFVIAEGVERLDQYEFLVNEGCDAIQGYLISKPLPTDKLSHLVTSDLRPK